MWDGVLVLVLLKNWSGDTFSGLILLPLPLLLLTTLVGALVCWPGLLLKVRLRLLLPLLLPVLWFRGPVGLGLGLFLLGLFLFIMDSGVIFGRLLRTAGLPLKGDSPGEGGCIRDTTTSLAR